MRSCASTTQVKIALGSMKQIMFVYNKLQKRFAAVYWVLFFTGGFIMERGTLSAASEWKRWTDLAQSSQETHGDPA